jgi:hypothetical protein
MTPNSQRQPKHPVTSFLTDPGSRSPAILAPSGALHRTLHERAAAEAASRHRESGLRYGGLLLQRIRNDDEELSARSEARQTDLHVLSDRVELQGRQQSVIKRGLAEGAQQWHQ